MPPGSDSNLVPTLEQLAALNPTTLATMHGASFSGDGAAQLRALSAVLGDAGRVTAVTPVTSCVALDAMRTRQIAACVLAVGALLTGCQSTDHRQRPHRTPGPRRAELPNPTALPFVHAATDEHLLTARRRRRPRRPRREALPPQNGYVFIQTKSGKTRCQISARGSRLRVAVHQSPEVDGPPANGVG